MHKNFKKAFAGSLMSAAMLATCVTSVIAPMSASAGQQLGQVDFDEAVGLPWHTCETNPARQTFDISGGTYNVHIETPKGSEGRWDLQLRHRGLHIEAGHKYTISGEITPSKDGFIYSKVGNYAGTEELWHNIAGKEWEPIQIKGGETFTFKDTFTATKTLDVAEWAFHYADGTPATQYQHKDTGFPQGTTIQFDNLSLIDETSDEFDWDKTNEFGVIRPKSNVRLNQVGYFSNLNKKASYVTDATSPLEFEVRNSSGTAVYTGKTTVFGADPDSGNGKTESFTDKNGNKLTKYKDSGSNVHIIDFSKVTDPGTYTIFVKDTTGVSGTQSGLTKAAYDTKVSGDKVMWTNWKTEKQYVMNESCKFEIKDDGLYGDLLRDSLSYYYQNRSGEPIDAKYIKNANPDSTAKLDHSEYGHSPDTAYVQSKWIKSYGNEFDGDSKYSITATGGWYDAGDHGKYVVNGGVSVWTLQNMYEMSKHLGLESKWDDGKSMLIPENSNNYPDILDEARVELEWFFDMMVKSDDPYYGKDAGMVYHKLHDHKWTGLAIHAWKYEGFDGCQRIVKPPTYAATLNMVACAAQAARLWEGIDDKFADECLENAKIGLAAVENSGNGWKVAAGKPKQQDDMKGTNAKGDDVYFAPLDQAIGGGPYGDTYVEDDYYWACCELFATTGDNTYYNKLKTYENPNDSTGMDKAFSLTSNLGGGENKGSLSSFNWGCTSGLGTLSLYLNKDKLLDSDAKTVVSSIKKAGDVYTDEQAAQGMGIPYHGSVFTDDINIGPGIIVDGYEWGSNSFVINNAIVMAYAYDATKDAKYANGASEALDYIFGRNGLDFSYVSGYGETTLTYPHHRFWAGGLDPDFPLAPKGVLSGGPGAGMQDPYIGGLGYTRGTLANQKCYVDSAEAWSVNEITINWNAPLAWMASWAEDVAPTVKEGTTIEDPTSGEVEGTGVWGDANQDGEVKINDAVLILQSISSPDKFGVTGSEKTHITKEGQYWGDVESFENGNITTMDALQIQKYLLGTITDLTPSGK